MSGPLKEEFHISTDKAKLDIELIHQYLSNESYWAKNIPKHLVEKSIEGSFCFGVYSNDQQVGFARVVTDFGTFAYVADVFIVPGCRGKGLSKLLMGSIMNHPKLQGLRRWMLTTRDAHGLYSQFSFVPLPFPERVMLYQPFSVYPDDGNEQ